jgi:transcriptional regulator with XRE-family HTH domain
MPDAVRGIAFALYQRVERERALRGLSSIALAESSGVARSTIAKWAIQQNTPQPEKVNAVADVLGIPREEALRLAGILTDQPNSEGIIPECIVEREVLATEGLSDEAKRDFVRAHRAAGHNANCGPFSATAAGEDEQASLAIA